jgi:hypothetical protein
MILNYVGDMEKIKSELKNLLKKCRTNEDRKKNNHKIISALASV